MKIENNTTKHKLAFLTWIIIYPLITLILFVFKDELIALPLMVRTFVLTILLVSLMQYVIMPRILKRFQNWIDNSEESSTKTTK
jgi:antibiotic biosynthesis monooxygenase (ABM) superfamily enzyme